MKSSQSDSIQVPVAEAVEVHEPSPRPAVRKSVWQVIRQLPYDATPEQKDSAVQANFHVEPMTWPKDAKLGLPGIKSERRQGFHARNRPVGHAFRFVRAVETRQGALS